MLLEVLARIVHRPDVHGAIAVGGKVKAIVVRHRFLARTGKIARHASGRHIPWKLPDVLGGASFITLRVTALERVPGEVENSIAAITSISSLRERHQFRNH